MNARLLRYTFHVSMLPVGGMIVVAALHSEGLAVGNVLIVISLMQLLVLQSAKHTMMLFISPDFKVLEDMGVSYVPAAYEPGRYKIDSRVCSFAMLLSAAAPVLMWLALLFPKKVCVTILNFATYTAPNTELMMFAFVSLLIGVLAFPFWFEASRAAEIYAEGSDRKRYLLRGFADKLDEKGAFREYISACRAHRSSDS